MNVDEYKDEHARTIIHIDIDCFYAQVEILKRPELKNVPLGIQQKNIVVTSNYIAREFGIRKCMLLTEAMQLCPNLVLVNGEDLNDYRTMSYKVTTLLQKYSEIVERLGLDENFVDVTKLVEQKLKNTDRSAGDPNQDVTNIVGSNDSYCQCGCEIRLKIGSLIADEMRRLIHNQLGLTSCAGIAHNKLLAKIVCSTHKPNQQSMLFPDSALELMLSLNNVESIPGIGRATSDILKSLGVRTVQDLQNAELSELHRLFEIDKAKFLQNLSFGIDNSPVKKSGKPLSLGLEDSCKLICAENEVKEKLGDLLKRLLLLVEADGRLPKTIKLTIRKFDKLTNTSRRETKQTNINPQFFTSGCVSQMNPNNIQKILMILMNMFRKLVRVHKPFHITLLGISLVKFNERPSFRNSIAPFLRKDIEVQSIISIENLNSNESSPESRTHSPSSCRESSDPECEPTPKRTKLSIFKRNFLEYDTCESPSKLRVQDLQLTSDSVQKVRCPSSIDESVFRELPLEMQQELWSEYKNSQIDYASCENKPKKIKSTNTILNYFVKQ
ncbi:DNA polymerase iota [Harmonia axyridis]|uniref:DNA polymerase iota n=1 Tax=Harmonia axyridis TaxID=115357 RepID=UPI001E277722|nr:DNA polymerase iota [Harmonia axyridis]XP_045481165.1 DNA polymerase iota [Harmonia axyridis]